MKNYIKFFENAIKNENLSHLYLVSGQDSENLLKEVLEICYLILKDDNEDLKLKNDILNFKYPYIHLINNNEEQIKKEDIQNLITDFNKTIFSENYHIYIINNFENINQSASNSMLKFLEEPISEKTIGFLLTNNISKVIPTIFSRSQHIIIPNVSQKEFIKKLEIETKWDKFDCEIMTVFTRNYSKSYELINDLKFKEIVIILKNIFLSILKCEANLSFKYYNELKKLELSSFYYKKIGESILIFLIDLLKFPSTDIIFSSMQSNINELKNSLKNENILKLIFATKDFLEKIEIPTNLNLQLFSYFVSLDGGIN